MYFEQCLTRKHLSVLGWVVNKLEEILVDTNYTEGSVQTGPSEAANAPGSQWSRNLWPERGQPVNLTTAG